MPYINRFFSEELNVVKLADMCGYSERHFRQIFKKKTGYSPSEYIIRRRIDNAKGLLVFTSESIVNVASLCGFSGANYLCRVFKKETGQTPAQWRAAAARTAMADLSADERTREQAMYI